MTASETRRVAPRVLARLASFYRRNSCLRVPDSARLAEGHRVYKKGCELRLILEDARELAEARRLLAAAGFRPGRPYRKGPRWVQPLYGHEAVARFVDLMV